MPKRQERRPRERVFEMPKEAAFDSNCITPGKSDLGLSDKYA